MYRHELWEEGFYMDTLEKYECLDCEKEFLIGKELSKGCKLKCPYCGKRDVEMTAYSGEEQLETLADDMGCLGLYVQL